MNITKETSKRIADTAACKFEYWNCGQLILCLDSKSPIDNMNRALCYACNLYVDFEAAHEQWLALRKLTIKAIWSKYQLDVKRMEKTFNKNR